MYAFPKKYQVSGSFMSSRMACLTSFIDSSTFLLRYWVKAWLQWNLSLGCVTGRTGTWGWVCFCLSLIDRGVRFRGPFIRLFGSLRSLFVCRGRARDSSSSRRWRGWVWSGIGECIRICWGIIKRFFRRRGGSRGLCLWGRRGGLFIFWCLLRKGE